MTEVAKLLLINKSSGEFGVTFILANCQIPAEPGTTLNFVKSIKLVLPLTAKLPISAVLHKIFKYNAPAEGRTNETL